MFFWFKKIFFHILGSAVALALSDYLLDSFQIVYQDSYVEYIRTVFLAVALLGVLNSIIKPILNVLTLPLRILTLGLSSIIINAGLLYITTILIPPFQVTWWEGYILLPITLSIINWLMHHIVKPKKKQ